MAGSQRGMGKGPRVRAQATAALRDKTWVGKGKGLVEVS